MRKEVDRDEGGVGVMFVLRLGMSMLAHVQKPRCRNISGCWYLTSYIRSKIIPSAERDFLPALQQPYLSLYRAPTQEESGRSAC